MFKFNPFSRSKTAPTALRSNRAVRRIGIGILSLFGLVTVLGLASAGYEAISASGDSDRFPPPGQMVEPVPERRKGGEQA